MSAPGPLGELLAEHGDPYPTAVPLDYREDEVAARRALRDWQELLRKYKLTRAYCCDVRRAGSTSRPYAGRARQPRTGWAVYLSRHDDGELRPNGDSAELAALLLRARWATGGTR